MEKKLDFELLFKKLLATAIENNDGNINDALYYDVGVTKDEAEKIKEWYGWED